MKKAIIVLLSIFFCAAFVSGDGCTIYPLAPQNDQYIKTTTPTFFFNVSGNLSVYNATLHIDSQEFGNVLLTPNNSQSQILANASLLEKQHEWYITSQTNDTECTSATRNIEIGTLRWLGADRLWRIIQDLVGIVPTLITLAIYGVVLFVLAILVQYIVRNLPKK